MLSLYPVLGSAFFVPGSRWQERLTLALLKVLLAASVSFASGLLFVYPSRANPAEGQSLLATLPVRLFFWAMAGMAILFAVSWFLEEYYVPMPPHGCCRR
jgi:cation transport ATPase